jgi:hypothetical protein
LVTALIGVIAITGGGQTGAAGRQVVGGAVGAEASRSTVNMYSR